MSLKMKLTSAIIMFMLIVATLVIGVIAAESQTISMKGNVSFNINDRSLYLKSVRYKVGNDATEPVTLENFLPGYIDANMEVNIGDHEFNYSAFTLYFDIVNTTANTYNAVEEVTLSPELISQGVTASASGQIQPTQEIDSDDDGYAEIMPTSEPTGTITLTITSTSTQAINLGDITITIKQYIPRNFTEEGFRISGNSITGYIGTATDLVIPSSYKIDETTGDYIEDNDGTGTPITTIGANAFQNNTTLTSITIPDTVISIGNGAFQDCRNLQTVNFGINSSLQTIGSSAFRVCNSLTTITIPETVTSIGDYAFFGCTSLQTVDLNNCQITEIPYGAFSNCPSLTTITIPEGVTSIGGWAFESCYALAIVYNNSTTLTITAGGSGVGYYAKEVVTDGQADGEIVIENQVQYYVNGSTKIALAPAVARNTLTSVTLASDTTEINQSAFQYCTSLTTITILETLTSIESHAFYGCSSLTTITIPETVESIGSNAFTDCRSLTTITIPETVTSIGDGAFAGCTSLQTVDFNNCQITSISGSAFSSCTSLTTITIPETVETIGSTAFADCSSLTTITIPEGVTSIVRYAFLNCSSLTTVVIESQYAYNNATSTSACEYLLEYAQTVKVLTRVVSAGTNDYLTNGEAFPHTWTEDGYTVFSKNPQS